MISSNDSGNRNFDLMRLRPVRMLFHWRGFPYVFQTVALLVFIGLAVLAWDSYAPDGVNAKLYAKSNLATLLIWGIWWPGMVWTAVLFGRVWCMICPMELVSNLSERVARSLGVKQLVLRRWVTSGALMVVFYALIQFLVAGAHINRVPAYTSLFLIGLLSMALLTGLIFKDRAFCRGFCPVGLLLATYGRGGMLAVRPASEKTCQTCNGKDCLAPCNRYRTDARSCPSLLNPSKLDSNRDCLICGQCIKSCTSNNVQLQLRRPFHANAVERFASWPVTIFVMLVSGFVTWELCAEWPKAEELFLTVPGLLNRSLGVSGLAGYIDALWAMVMFPLGVWSLIGLGKWCCGKSANLGEFWQQTALPIAIVVSAGHMSKGLAKFVAWAGFLPYALNDPSGRQTAIGISQGIFPKPVELLSLSAVAIVASILIGFSVFFASRETKASQTDSGYRILAIKAAFAASFLIVILAHAVSGN